MANLIETMRRLGPGGLSPDQFIKTLYRTLLLREPEEPDVPYWRKALTNGKGPEFVLNEFLRSAEFRNKLQFLVDMHPYDTAPAQTIEAEVGDVDLKRLWDHVAKTWSKLGAEEPYLSVLTDPRYRRDVMLNGQAIEAFYSTGAGDLARLEKWLSRNHVSIEPDGLCVEYGCGVGRCTEWLARRFHRVRAIDVSWDHLALAMRRAQDFSSR